MQKKNKINNASFTAYYAPKNNSYRVVRNKTTDIIGSFRQNVLALNYQVSYFEHGELQDLADICDACKSELKEAMADVVLTEKVRKHFH